MTTLRRYKEFPKLEDLDPGIEPGWDFDVLVLQAEPETTTKGGIILADATRDNEQGAATDWMIVGISPRRSCLKTGSAPASLSVCAG